MGPQMVVSEVGRTVHVADTRGSSRPWQVEALCGKTVKRVFVLRSIHDVRDGDYTACTKCLPLSSVLRLAFRTDEYAKEEQR